MSRGKTSFAAILLAVTLCITSSSIAAESSYLPGVAVVKLSPSYRIDLPEGGASQFGVQSLDEALAKIGVTKVEVKFWGAQPPEKGKTDITRYYNLYFSDELSVKDVCKDLMALDGVENAEPWPVLRLYLNHNDTRRGEQYGLNLCQANEAHDICTGDRNVPVAIVDTGVDLEHVDLVDNIWVNPGEDLDGDGVITDNDRDGRDSDGNGYRDDFHGWDFTSRDNDPDDEDFHGTHCAGIASGVTNNRRGIASIGYSCGLMAVRCGSGMSIMWGYEGIRYAVDAGAKVISCSWGGEGADFGHDIVRYASEHDVLVFAASSNEGVNSPVYPGAYEEVTCVAATNSQDQRADWSNYGIWVDISAPGAGILSTVPNNGYDYLDGTSMATPFAAGVAILLRAKYPAMTRGEILDLLFNGADNIDAQNRAYVGKLGAGRINAFRSLQLGNRPILDMSDFRVSIDGNNNGKLDPSEEASFVVTVSNSNHGVGTDGISVTLTTEDSSLTITHETSELTDIGPGETISNIDDPFVVSANNVHAHTSWVTVNILANPGDVELSKTFEIVIGNPDILIVDDDDGAASDTTYVKLVERTGHGWQRWDVSTQFSPEPEELTSHKMVIWSTGASVPPLDEIDRWEIENSMLEGANIVLIGNRIGDDPDNQVLLYDLFGAQHEQDSVQAYTVSGIGGDRILAANLQIPFPNMDARRSPSTMSPANDADSLLNYFMGNNYRGLAAVYRNDEDNHSKSAYLGFAFDLASDSRTPRTTVINSLYSWITAEDPNATPHDQFESPRLFSLAPAYPNPFNGMVALRFTVPAATPYRLSLVDPLGREVALLRAGDQASGMQTVTWDAQGMPAGVYFARLTSSGYNSATQRLLLVK